MKIIKIILGFLVIILIGLIFFVFAFMNNDKKTIVDGLEIKNNYYQKISGFNEIGYIDYEKVYAKSRQDVNKTGIYSDTTKDGKIKWNESHVYKKSANLPDFFNQISLNGQSINLPTSFEKMGWDYMPFDNINALEISQDKMPIHFKNIKNSYFLEIIDFKEQIEESDDGTKFNISTCFGALGMNDKYLMNIGFLYGNGKKVIINLQTSIDSGIESDFDLKIGGIGIGNTFNEMYETLGTPYSVDINGNRRLVKYNYLDGVNGKIYYVNFEYNPYAANGKTKDYSHIHNNIITTVDMVSLDVKDTKVK